ncbi:MAG: MauE/DoxX family redox-associated membrane protein [Opitutaceae bacterium]
MTTGRNILRFLLGAVFCYAGVAKALNPAQFTIDIDHYRLLPYVALVPLALYLPWLEIVAGAGVILGPARRGALLVLLALNIGFTLAIGSALARGLDITCGCFGAALSMPLSLSLGRNLLLGAASLWLLYDEKRAASRLPPPVVTN